MESVVQFLLSRQKQAMRDLEFYSLLLQEVEQALKNQKKTELSEKFLKVIASKEQGEIK